MKWVDDIIDTIVSTIFLWPRNINNMNNSQITKIYSEISSQRQYNYRPIFK